MTLACVVRLTRFGDCAVILVVGLGCTNTSPASPADAGAMEAGDPDKDGAGAAADEDAWGSDAGPADPSLVFASCAALPQMGDFPVEVGAVIRAKCQTCHKIPAAQHAPFPLLTYEQTLNADSVAPYSGQPIWQAMHYVIQTQPPKGGPHMPFGSAPQLTASEFQTLDGWLLGCAMPVPEGTGGDADNVADSGSEALTVADAPGD